MITNFLRAMVLHKPCTQRFLLKHPSLVPKGHMKPPFVINGTDCQISLGHLIYKTAFLVSLTSGTRSSELMALPRADHNPSFSSRPSGAHHVSIKLVPECLPMNVTPNIISKPLQGWGLLSRFPPFRYFPNFSTSPKYMLAIEYHVLIWQVSPQPSCDDTCQIWIRFKECNRYFCEIENFAYREIEERSFSNPHPCSQGLLTSSLVSWSNPWVQFESWPFMWFRPKAWLTRPPLRNFSSSSKPTPKS